MLELLASYGYAFYPIAVYSLTPDPYLLTGSPPSRGTSTVSLLCSNGRQQPLSSWDPGILKLASIFRCMNRKKRIEDHTVPEPLVSVIIPTFNRAHCVGKAIDSALGQTHRNTEILVLDDGSTDGTRDLIERSYEGDARVRYFFHENRGVTATRNRGISLCRGDFVALLDSDDTWSPWKLELQLACLRHCPEVGMVWTDMEAVGPAGEVVSQSYLRTMYTPTDGSPVKSYFRNPSPCPRSPRELATVVGDRRLHTGEIFSQMIMGNLVHTSTVLIRRERIEKVGGFNEELRIPARITISTCGRAGRVPSGSSTSPRFAIRPDCRISLSQSRYKVHVAKNCLKTVLPWIEHERSQINCRTGCSGSGWRRCMAGWAMCS